MSYLQGGVPAPGGNINNFGNTNAGFTNQVLGELNSVQEQEGHNLIAAAHRQAERNRNNRLFDEGLQHVQDKFTQHKNVVNNLGGAAGA